MVDCRQTNDDEITPRLAQWVVTKSVGWSKMTKRPQIGRKQLHNVRLDVAGDRQRHAWHERAEGGRQRLRNHICRLCMYNVKSYNK